MSFCNERIDSHVFSKNIKNGELILWMAEVLDCVDKTELDELVSSIILSIQYINQRFVYDRKKWNYEIQKLCFDKIQEEVLKLCE